MNPAWAAACAWAALQSGTLSGAALFFLIWAALRIFID